MNDTANVDNKTTTEIEAAVFRRLLAHLRARTDVQNIDLMILADFCRNCLAKWYVTEAQQVGREIDYDTAREIIYGMPYKQWKEKYQSEATAEQLEKFNQRRPSPQN